MKAHKNNKSQTKLIRIPFDMLEAINHQRGDISFSEWVKDAITAKLSPPATTAETPTAKAPVTEQEPPEPILNGKDNRAELKADAIALFNDNTDEEIAIKWNSKGYLSARGDCFNKNSVRNIRINKGA